MRSHGLYSKKSLWQRHFLFLSFFLCFFTLNSSSYSLQMQRVVTSDHTQWRIHTRYDSSGREIGPSRRLLPEDRHAPEADIHAPAETQTRNRRKRADDTHALDRAATEDRPRAILGVNNHHTNFPGIKPRLPQWDALCTQRPCGKTMTAGFRVSGSIQDVFVTYLCWTKCHINTFLLGFLWASPPNLTTTTSSVGTQLARG
jgi:hypothetical protein